MLSWILPYIRDAEARAIPPYQQFLRNEASFIRDQYKRLYLGQGHESPGIKLLRYILSFVDLDYLDTCANNYERYRYHLRFIREDLTNTFDRAERGRGYHNLFFRRSRFVTEEFVVPVEDLNTVVNLPLYTEDWSTWKKVKPVRLWSHDSNEFTIKLLHDQMQYSFLAPSYAVVLLDVVALVFKYYIWYKHQRHQEPAEELVESIPQQYFLHKYVMCDWVWDAADSWLLNMLTKIITQPDTLDEFRADALQIESQYGWIAANSYEGFRSIAQLCDKVKGNLRPEAFLSSKLLYSGSIHQRIRIAEEQLNLPQLRQYDWLRWLRDRELFLTYIQVWQLRPELPTTKSLLRVVDRQMQRLLRRRPWNNCNNVFLKHELEADLEQVAAQLLG